MRAMDLKAKLRAENKIVPLLELLHMHSINCSNPKQITCGFEDGDNTGSCVVYINSDYLNTIAYTRNIEDKNGNKDKSHTDIINLVMFVKSIPTYDLAKEWIMSTMGIENVKSNKSFSRDTSFFSKFKKSGNQREEQIYYDESILNKYSNDIHIDLIKKDGLINIDVLRKYHVMFDERSNRILFPHYKWDDCTKIAGISGRTIVPNYEALNINKYMSMLPTRYDKTKNLYALCWNREEIEKQKKIILFEAEKSCMKLDTIKQPPIGVAVGCHSISKEQFKIIMSLNIDEVIIAFDKDVCESEIRDKCKIFYDYIKVSYIYDKWNLLKEKDSPIDVGHKKWLYLYNHRTVYDGKDLKYE